ncbi:head-tail joining protein [Microbulbifer sp. JTAC008]|uniref:head-tail joining protein n=1 Tax=Microbulbifer sp. JTAC008 TaxID=3243374 RepID=UPI00403A2B1E
MDLDQRAAERAFRKWGKAATYDDGSGGEPIDCLVIFEQEIDDFDDEERVRVPRVELSLLVSEVGTYNSEAVVTLGGEEYKVRKRLGDDGVVRRALVDCEIPS